MELEIITMYVVCDDYLKATQYWEDSQTEMTTAQVMTTALVAAKFFKNCLEHGRVFLKEAGYIGNPTGTFRMLSESRLNRRVHAIPEHVWLGLFYALADVHKQSNEGQEYIVDSLPVAVCDNYRIRRCRLYRADVVGAAEHLEAGEKYLNRVVAEWEDILLCSSRLRTRISLSGEQNRVLEVSIAPSYPASVISSFYSFRCDYLQPLWALGLGMAKISCHNVTARKYPKFCV